MEQLMDIQPIRTDEDHRTALAVIDACWGAPEDDASGRSAYLLILHFPRRPGLYWHYEVEASRLLR